MSEKSEFAQRLIAAIGAAGYEARPSVIEKQFNSRYWGRPVTFQAVRRWLRGDSIPAQDKLVVLAEWLDVDPQMLRYGAPAGWAVKEKRKQWEAKLNPEDKQLFDTYLTLPATKRKLVRDVILAFAAAEKTGSNRH